MVKKFKLNYKNKIIKQKRQKFLDTEILLLSCKALTQARFSDRLKSIQFFQIKYYQPLVMIPNHCLYTFNSRNIFRRFKVSRSIFRKTAVSGGFPGIFKAIW